MNKYQGLNRQEVENRFKNGMNNKLYKAKSKSYSEIIKDNVFTLFNIINFVLAALVIAVSFHEPQNLLNLSFMGLIISNSMIGIIQEIKAKRVVDKLSILTQTTVNVIRNGEESQIPVQQIVIDDIIKLKSGNQVMIDGEYLDGQSFELDESLLTGETDPIYKKKGDKILSGSVVLSGYAYVKVEKVADKTYVANLSDIVKAQGGIKSQIMYSLNKIVKILSIIIIPVGIALFCTKFFHKELFSFTKIILSTVAALIGMIPEGLVLLVSIAFAVSVTKLGLKYHTLVQNLPSIESLARVSTLCLDKTGTLTTGKMLVLGLLNLNENLNETSLEKNLCQTLKEKNIQTLLLSTIKSQISNNPSAKALQVYADEILKSNQKNFCFTNTNLKNTSMVNLTIDETYELLPAQNVLDFSSKRKYCASQFTDRNLNEQLCLIGAPEIILKNNPRLLSSYQKIWNYFTMQGLRCLLFAVYPANLTWDGKINSADSQNLPQPSSLNLIILADEIRKQAAEMLSYFRKQNVKLALISGDNPQTVAALAKRCGFFRNLQTNTTRKNNDHSDKTENQSINNRKPYELSQVENLYENELQLIADMSQEKQIEHLSDQEAAEAYRDLVKEKSVFGRVSPKQKKALISAMQLNGEYVGMTGDGVNDVPALKKADCAIAMVSGSDAARACADLILMKDDLSCLIPAVYEGRKIINNIERVAALFLTKTVYSVLLALIFIFLPLRFPIIPIQITLISVLTIGLPGFVLALKPNYELVKGRFFERILLKSLPAGIAISTCVFLNNLIGYFFRLKPEYLSQTSPLIIACGAFYVLAQLCRPWDKIKISLFAFCLSTFVFLVYNLRQILNFEYLKYQNIYGLISPILLIACPFIIIFLQKIQQKYRILNYLVPFNS